MIPVIECETLRDIVAAVELPAANIEPSLSQVKVMYELAFDGVQFWLVRFNVTGIVPEFLM